MGANDRLATGLIGEPLRMGMRVPDDISIVGYDDSRIAGLPHIDLTTVRQSPGEIARLAARAIVGRLDDGRALTSGYILDPSLMARGSTSAPGG